MLKAYFDGSVMAGKALTLACLAGYGAVWSGLEAKWEAVRRDRGNPPHIHMTDLMALQGLYKDWSAEQRDCLVDGLLNVLLDFRGDKRLRSFTCTIDLAAHERWTGIRNHPSPARLCARILVPQVMDWYSTSDVRLLEAIELCFDRNEPFMHHIQADWRNKRVRKERPALGLIKRIASEVMESTPRLQMADVIAWGRNRLAAGSTWERDGVDLYATAVRASASLLGPHTPIGEDALSRSYFAEEGAEAFNRQRRNRRA
jgi:hypothetical protein